MRWIKISEHFPDLDQVVYVFSEDFGIGKKWMTKNPEFEEILKEKIMGFQQFQNVHQSPYIYFSWAYWDNGKMHTIDLRHYDYWHLIKCHEYEIIKKANTMKPWQFPKVLDDKE